VGLQVRVRRAVFYLGDTVYNLFGMAFCSGDVAGFLRRRAAQGFNLFRVRVPVSPFHPPHGYSDWQTRRTWPWGGSEQAPQLDRFNLDYFQSVDDVFRAAEALGVGFEVIMEAWGSSTHSTGAMCRPRVGAAMDAVPHRAIRRVACTHVWTLMNEYEYYPDGVWRYNRAPTCGPCVCALGQGIASHGHVSPCTTGPACRLSRSGSPWTPAPWTPSVPGLGLA
jgi:hypothetical protein